MKLRNPKNRFDIQVSSKDYVLDVGGGHNPHPRADVVVDKFTDTNFHRSGDIKVLGKQKFIHADGENLPFADKEFDYVICCHVLEHVDNPVQFLSELFRVGKRGYIETPSLIGEYMLPIESHKWLLHEKNDRLYLVDKEKIGFVYGYSLRDLFQEYFPRNSVGFKIMERTHPNMLTVRIEWEHDFAFEVEPSDTEIRKYFTGKWQKEWAADFFPARSMAGEFKEALAALWDIGVSVIRSKLLKKGKND